MRKFRSLLAVAMVALSAGCSGSLDSLTTGDIVGRWTADLEAASPAGYYSRQVTFSGDGHFVFEFRSYGIYRNQRDDELSSYSRTVGTYTVSGDRVTFEPESLTTWDAFHGADSPEIVQSPYPYSSFYDDARYLVEGNTLMLDYTSYPADAPEPTRQTFQRER